MSKTDKSIPVHIYLVLDESGSMNSLTEDVIGGVNKMLDEQKVQPGKCRVTIVAFDTERYHLIHDAVKLKDVPQLTKADYSPRGGTPLLDAEGRTLTAAVARQDARLAAGKVEEAVLVATFTDGHENASTEWKFEQLKAFKAQLEERGWAFTYLGVGLDAYAHGNQAQRTGVVMASATRAAATPDGVDLSYANLSKGLTNARSFAGRGERIDTSNVYAGTGVETLAEEPADSSS